MKTINTICKNCDKEFNQRNVSEKYLKIFCNSSCAASYNNKHKDRVCNYKKTATCVQCNIDFLYVSSSSKGLYCSNKCHKDHMFFQKIEEANKGLINGVTLKKVLISQRGNKCEWCNVSSWNGKPLTLHMDHINGNSDDNLPSNLRLLCPNCHSQTETYGGKNRKNTKRSSYMKRYRIKNLHKVVRTAGFEPAVIASV